MCLVAWWGDAVDCGFLCFGQVPPNSRDSGAVKQLSLGPEDVLSQQNLQQSGAPNVPLLTL